MTMAADTVPTAFISYVAQESRERAWVKALADRLRADGIDCRIDQYESPRPAGGWSSWMKAQLDEVDYVVVLWDEAYVQRAQPTNAAKTGVEVEAEIIQHAIEQRSLKADVVLIERPDRPPAATPHWFRSAARIRIADPGDDGYEDLFRWLSKQPRNVRPPVGPLRRLDGEANSVPADARPPETEPNQLERALRDRHPERCGATALESEQSTRTLAQRLLMIDPDDLRELIRRTTERYTFDAIELVLVAEHLFLAVGLRLCGGERDLLGSELAHALWRCCHESSAVLWDDHPSYPRTIDVRDTNLRALWWAACWSWSLHITAPPDLEETSGAPLFPGWVCEDLNAFLNIGNLNRCLGNRPYNASDALLLDLGLQLWRRWGDPATAVVPWALVVAAVADAARRRAPLEPDMADLLFAMSVRSEISESLLEILRREAKSAQAAANALLGDAAASSRALLNELAVIPGVIEFVAEFANSERLEAHAEKWGGYFTEGLLERLPVDARRAALRGAIQRSPWIHQTLTSPAFTGVDLVEQLFESSKGRNFEFAQAVWRARPDDATRIARRWWKQDREAAKFWITESGDRLDALLDLFETSDIATWPSWVDDWLVFLGRRRGPEARRIHRIVTRRRAHLDGCNLS